MGTNADPHVSGLARDDAQQSPAGRSTPRISPALDGCCDAASPAVRCAVTDLCLIIGFYVLGVLLLGTVENWSFLDRIYFISVTVSTTGYGDLLVGKKPASRIVCSVLIVVGVPLIFSIIKRNAMALHCIVKKLERRFLRAPGQGTTSGDELPISCYSPDQVKQYVNYCREYVVALAPLILLMLICFILAVTRMQKSAVDALYFTIVTLFTVGYGDIAPKSPVNRACYAIFLLALVCVTSNTIQEIIKINTRWLVRDGGLAIVDLEELMVRKAEEDPNNVEDPVITESEFIVEALLRDKIVDQQIINSIRRAYHWTAINRRDPEHSSRGIDASSIYENWYRQLSKHSTSHSLESSSFDDAECGWWRKCRWKCCWRDVAKVPEPDNSLALDLTIMPYSEWRQKYWDPKIASARNRGAKKSLARARSTALRYPTGLLLEITRYHDREHGTGIASL